MRKLLGFGLIAVVVSILIVMGVSFIRNQTKPVPSVASTAETAVVNADTAANYGGELKPEGNLPKAQASAEAKAETQAAEESAVLLTLQRFLDAETSNKPEDYEIVMAKTLLAYDSKDSVERSQVIENAKQALYAGRSVMYDRVMGRPEIHPDKDDNGTAAYTVNYTHRIAIDTPGGLRVPVVKTVMIFEQENNEWRIKGVHNFLQSLQ